MKTPYEYAEYATKHSEEKAREIFPDANDSEVVNFTVGYLKSELIQALHFLKQFDPEKYKILYG